MMLMMMIIRQRNLINQKHFKNLKKILKAKKANKINDNITM